MGKGHCEKCGGHTASNCCSCAWHQQDEALRAMKLDVAIAKAQAVAAKDCGGEDNACGTPCGFCQACLKKLLAYAEAIVGRLADLDPIQSEEYPCNYRCGICQVGADCDGFGRQPDPYPHAADCVWVAAVKARDATARSRERRGAGTES